MASLLAISDLHVRYRANAEFVDRIRPRSAGDWLIVAGDVADRFDEIVTTLALLAERFETVMWVPGNHELWTPSGDAGAGRGVARYERLVAALRRAGVHTPEDPYPVWDGPGGPVTICPLFVPYDYTFLPRGAATKAEAIALAEAAGVMCTDESLLYPDPYPTREDWSAARVAYSIERLNRLPASAATILVNHWPLIREPTQVLRHPEFALWCGTVATADWPVRYRARAVVYGHLHIPRTLIADGIPHHEVSLGYPREWQRPGAAPRGLVPVLGASADPGAP